MDMITPNFELANARLADLSERELENYICQHGPRRYDRNELRTIIAANMQPDIYPERINVYLALAIYLYRAGHTRTTVRGIRSRSFS